MAPEIWYVHPNDLIGGWSVMSVDRPPSTLVRGEEGREVGDFVREEDARRVVELHNADLAGRLLPDGGETRTDWGMRDRTGKVYPARDEADARDLAAHHARRGVEVVRRSVWTGSWVEVTDEAR